MLAEVCGYLNNYFDVKRYTGKIRIQNGVVYCDSKEIAMSQGQHFTLLRKNFVLGVYEYGKDTLDDKDEFEGRVWIMDIPADFMSLVTEISAWQTKYGAAGSASMSPFNSESFGGYSYTKGSTSGSAGTAACWQDAYGSRLARYKKVSLL